MGSVLYLHADWDSENRHHQIATVAGILQTWGTMEIRLKGSGSIAGSAVHVKVHMGGTVPVTTMTYTTESAAV